MRDIWRTVFAIAMVLMAVSIVSAENVYVDNNPAKDVPPDVYGWLEVHIRGVTVQDANVLVARRDTAVNLSYLPDHTENVQEQNPSLFVIRVLTDGVSKPEMLATGLYTAYLRQGNADQPESIDFEIGNMDTTRIVFLGAAYASGDEGCCFCHNVTVVDVPGSIIHHPEVNHTIMHPAGVEVIVVVDSPAWCETTHHPGILHRTCYPEVSYTQKQLYYYTNSKGWQVTTSWKNGTCPAFETIFPRMCEEERVIVSEPYCENDWVIDMEEHDEIVCHPEVNHTETRPVGDPWYEVVVDTPAWDEQVGAVSHEERVCGRKLVCPCGCARGERR